MRTRSSSVSGPAAGSSSSQRLRPLTVKRGWTACRTRSRVSNSISPAFILCMASYQGSGTAQRGRAFFVLSSSRHALRRIGERFKVFSESARSISQRDFCLSTLAQHRRGCRVVSPRGDPWAQPAFAALENPMLRKDRHPRCGRGNIAENPSSVAMREKGRGGRSRILGDLSRISGRGSYAQPPAASR